MPHPLIFTAPCLLQNQRQRREADADAKVQIFPETERRKTFFFLSIQSTTNYLVNLTFIILCYFVNRCINSKGTDTGIIRVHIKVHQGPEGTLFFRASHL